MQAKTRTTGGVLTGSLSVDGTIACFRGIPYAKPPTGPLRWQPPQQADHWSGERPAVTPGAASLQQPLPANSYMFNEEREFSEDCLYLNVFTGSLDAAERRPVVVWFHMGAFNLGWSGGPQYDGTSLARAGVVVVTVNYRLGRLGFLAHPALSAESKDRSSGNYGLQDQLAALRWVQENIAAFGGDPACVTVYGVSAGACSVSILMAAPAAKSLIHRAVGGSGGSFGPTVNGPGTRFASCFQSLEAAESSGAAYMRGLGANTAAEMRALPAERLLGNVFTGKPDFLETLYPIVDGRVVPDNPFDLFVQRRHNDIPLLTGSNAEEHLPGYTDLALFERHNPELFAAGAVDIKRTYPMGSLEETQMSTSHIGGDRVFGWQNWTWARLQARFGLRPAYYYHFAYEPPIPEGRYAEQTKAPHMGAAHALEIPYVWRNLEGRQWNTTAVDEHLSSVMSGYWLNFARTGDPNGVGLPLWPRFGLDDPQLMLFVDRPRAEAAPVVALRDRFRYWDRAFQREFASD